MWALRAQLKTQSNYGKITGWIRLQMKMLVVNTLTMAREGVMAVDMGDIVDINRYIKIEINNFQKANLDENLFGMYTLFTEANH
jgi:hypothetical protein